jgi:hypothetical protein
MVDRKQHPLAINHQTMRERPTTPGSADLEHSALTVAFDRRRHRQFGSGFGFIGGAP